MRGGAIAEPMLGHIAELDRIYRIVSDDEFGRLVDRYPEFARYARLMEQVSERHEQMLAKGTHPYPDLPRLPKPLADSLMAVMRDAAEIEREFQTAVDAGSLDQAGRFAAMRRQWADDLERLIADIRGSELPANSNAVLQKVLKVAAERITRLA